MVAPANLTHFSWSFKLGTFIIVNILDTFNKILQGDYRISNCY